MEFQEDIQDDEDIQIPQVKKICYYEQLGVDRKATTEEIKSAYKKMALKNHPDKNKDKPDAKEIFQQLNVSYQTLIDPNERTWYDNHRQQILSGKTKKEGHEMSKQDKDEELWGGIKMFKYLQDSCYKGYSDESKGFYTVFRELFEKLKDLEEDNSEEKLEKRPPGFGDMNYDVYKVNQFYEHWESFSSGRLFSFADIQNPNESENRWEKRQIEKENKKERQLEKIKYIKTIKNVVEFAKKRDQRYRNYEIQQKLDQQQKKDQKKREIEEKKAQRLIEQQQEMNEKQKILEEQRQRQIKNQEEQALKQKLLNEQENQESEKLFFCEDCNVDFSKDYMPKVQLKKHCDTKEHRKKAELRLLDKLRKSKKGKEKIVFQPKEKEQTTMKFQPREKVNIEEEQKVCEPEIVQIQPVVVEENINKIQKNGDQKIPEQQIQNEKIEKKIEQVEQNIQKEEINNTQQNGQNIKEKIERPSTATQQTVQNKKKKKKKN